MYGALIVNVAHPNDYCMHVACGKAMNIASNEEECLLVYTVGLLTSIIEY